jgi:hypothetical protein
MLVKKQGRLVGKCGLGVMMMQEAEFMLMGEDSGLYIHEKHTCKPPSEGGFPYLPANILL